jgi:hypothetical protein
MASRRLLLFTMERSFPGRRSGCHPHAPSRPTDAVRARPRRSKACWSAVLRCVPGRAMCYRLQRQRFLRTHYSMATAKRHDSRGRVGLDATGRRSTVIISRELIVTDDLFGDPADAAASRAGKFHDRTVRLSVDSESLHFLNHCINIRPRWSRAHTSPTKSRTPAGSGSTDTYSRHSNREI